MKKTILLTAVAAIAGFSYAGATDYEKVILESVEGITDGNYLIVSPEGAAVMGAHNGGIFDAVALEGLSAETGTITGSDEYSVVSITKVEGGYWLKIGEQFLTQTAKNKLTVTETETLASITYDNNILKIFANPKAAIQSVATSWIQYNAQNPRFAGYSSAQTPIVLFREIETIEPVDYSTGLEGVNIDGTRYSSKLSVSSSDGHSIELTDLQSASDKSVYFDRSATTLTAGAGSTVTFTLTHGRDSWMHKFIYVDWDNNGFIYDDESSYIATSGVIKPGVDLVNYELCFQDWTSHTDATLLNPQGQNVTGDNRSMNPNTPISITIPENTTPGAYRARFKLDWASLDPNGSKIIGNTIQKNDGVIVDFTIEIIENTDCRPEGHAALDVLANVPAIWSADAITTARKAIDALPADASIEQVMAEITPVYASAIGKQIRLYNVADADLALGYSYLCGHALGLTYNSSDAAESDLAALWTIEAGQTDTTYRLFCYGLQTHLSTDYQIIAPTAIDNSAAPACVIATNQIALRAVTNADNDLGYILLSADVITSGAITDPAAQWRVALVDHSTFTPVAGAYDSKTGLYTIKSADPALTFTHNATRHSSHTVDLTAEDGTTTSLSATDAGNGLFTVDLTELPKGHYDLSIPYGYFATADCFSAAHTDAIEHTYEKSDAITEINADATTGATRWYTIQGRRVAAPVSGHIYLRATTAGVEKILVK